MIDVRWTTAFLDFPPATHHAGTRFWARVTGSTLSPPRGDHREFATLVPGAGDGFLRVQRLADGPARVHLDLHVADLEAGTTAAVSSGATVVHRWDDGDVVVLRSPAGLVFCLVPFPAAPGTRWHRPPPSPWSGHLSLVDQITVDVAPEDADREVGFWAALTGGEPLRPHWAGPFRPLLRPDGQPLRIMLHRLDRGRGPATAHLDLAGTDRAAETERHTRLGAVVHAVHDDFTVLTDPAGLAYCITDRDPISGLLPH